MASGADLRIILVVVILIFDVIALGFGIAAGVLQIKKVNGSSSDDCHVRGGFNALWVVSFLGLVIAVAAFGKIAWSLHKDATESKGTGAVIICYYTSILVVFIAALYLLIAGKGVGRRSSSSSGDYIGTSSSSSCVISHPNFIFIGGVGGSLLNIVLVYLYLVYID